MTKVKIAFQGERGAYSHIACNELFKDAEIKHVLHLKRLLRQHSRTKIAE